MHVRSHGGHHEHAKETHHRTHGHHVEERGIIETLGLKVRSPTSLLVASCAHLCVPRLPRVLRPSSLTKRKVRSKTRSIPPRRPSARQRMHLALRRTLAHTPPSVCGEVSRAALKTVDQATDKISDVGDVVRVIACLACVC